MSSVLVTGSKGFIGRHVVRALEGAGHDVVGFDWPRNLCEVGEVREFDAIVNLAAIGGVGRAARDTAELVKNNVGAAIALRGAIKGGEVKVPYPYRGKADRYDADPTTPDGHITGPGMGYRRTWPLIVHISSFSIYGDAKEVPTTEACPPAPKEMYGASKYMQELAFTGYPGPLVVLRLSSVYGPGMNLDAEDATVIAKIARAKRDGEVFRVNEDGQQTRDFVHVKDVCAAIVACIDYHEDEVELPCFPSNVINVCSGRATAILEACDKLQCRCEVTGEKRAGDMRQCLGDATRFKHLVGRDPMPFAPLDILG